MAIESIDQAKESTSAFDRLVNNAYAYVSGDMTSVKERLKLERDMMKYASQNTPDWLLNIVVSIYERQKEEA